MLSEQEAIRRIRQVFPTDDVRPPVEYNDVYLFQVFTSDPDEGDQDPFFSVNRQTGAVRDFSIITDGDINVITDLFLEKQALTKKE